jgi:hypothetical protein
VYDDRILKGDTPEPDQEVDELPKCNVDGKPASFLQGLDLALDPRKDSVEEVFRGLYVATLSIKLR